MKYTRRRLPRPGDWFINHPVNSMLCYDLSEVLPGAVHKVVTVRQITSVSEPDLVCDFTWRHSMLIAQIPMDWRSIRFDCSDIEAIILHWVMDLIRLVVVDHCSIPWATAAWLSGCICRRPIIRRSLSSDPSSPASKVAAVNLDVASQNGLSQTFLCRCFEVSSSEVTALMTVDDGRTLSSRNRTRHRACMAPLRRTASLT